MKILSKLFVAFGLLFLIIMAVPTFAQSKKNIGEECTKDADCKTGKSVMVTVKGRRKRICADCSQSSLDSYTRNVTTFCKAFDAAWTPAKSPEYQRALAKDGRVQVKVYDQIANKAKKCKKAREDREKACFGGGDADHIRAINHVKGSISRIVKHKYTQIKDKRVFYCSVSNYNSKLARFKDKCKLRFQDIKRDLTIMKKEYDKGNKVNCSKIQRYESDCEKCYEKAKELLSYGFSGSTSKMPDDYLKILKKAEKNFRQAKDLHSKVKGKKLCK
ncbi:hypothetical protein [uncultured Microscilla sp.]|uniref:hypothetical protein n=1 Tax=uncultured Microscilla sp. TaxID=432653 RepID=UPI002626B259|nr:hypothetical protein [uncultured Microscilla sp.]